MEFQRPDVVKGLIGPYSISAVYYDNGYNVVTKGEKAGRYGPFALGLMRAGGVVTLLAIGGVLAFFWIREARRFDAVLDFEKVVQDPQNPLRIRKELTSDYVHPNTEGYRLMAESVPLELFTK